MNNNTNAKASQAQEGSQHTGSQFDPPTLATTLPQEMDRDLQGAIAAAHHANAAKFPPHLLRAPRPFNVAPVPANERNGAHPHIKVHKPIQRWLAETEKEKAWDAVGAVVKETDHAKTKRASSWGAKGWSDGAHDGSEHRRVHR